MSLPRVKFKGGKICVSKFKYEWRRETTKIEINGQFAELWSLAWLKKVWNFNWGEASRYTLWQNSVFCPIIWFEFMLFLARKFKLFCNLTSFHQKSNFSTKIALWPQCAKHEAVLQKSPTQCDVMAHNSYFQCQECHFLCLVFSSPAIDFLLTTPVTILVPISSFICIIGP